MNDMCKQREEKLIGSRLHAKNCSVLLLGHRGAAAGASHRPAAIGGFNICTLCRLKEDFLSYVYIVNMLYVGLIIACVCLDVLQSVRATLFISASQRKQVNTHTCVQGHTPLDADVF